MARSSVEIKLDHGGMAALLKSNDMERALRPIAERVLAAAQADPHDDTGAYEAALHIESDTTDRVVLRVVSGDFKGHILEAKYGILSRALDSA